MAYTLMLFQLLLTLLARTATSEDVYFDKYGHCQDHGPFDLTSDKYVVHHVGGGLYHETKDCRLQFKAPPKNGICITYKEFYIDDCSVSLLVYRGEFRGIDHFWKKFTCKDKDPSQMCTSDLFVVLRVLKKHLNRNKGYSFKIEVEKSSSVTEGGVVFASLGVVLGIIAIVVFLLIILAVLIIYCCPRHQHKEDSSQSCKQTAAAPSDIRIQPTAPPDPATPSAPLMSEGVPHSPDHPDPPPPYSEHPN